MCNFKVYSKPYLIAIKGVPLRAFSQLLNFSRSLSDRSPRCEQNCFIRSMYRGIWNVHSLYGQVNGAFFVSSFGDEGKFLYVQATF